MRNLKKWTAELKELVKYSERKANCFLPLSAGSQGYKEIANKLEDVIQEMELQEVADSRNAEVFKYLEAKLHSWRRDIRNILNDIKEDKYRYLIDYTEELELLMKEMERMEDSCS